MIACKFKIMRSGPKIVTVVYLFGWRMWSGLYLTLLNSVYHHTSKTADITDTVFDRKR